MQRRFRRFYNSRTAPKPDTIKDIVRRFEENGNVVDTARPGPCQTMRTLINIEKVKRKLADSPHRSSRRLSRELQLSRTAVRRMLVDDLNLFSYKIQILQKQSTVQKENRLTFAKLVAGKVEKKEIEIGNIDWSDEAHFHFSRHVNKQNMRIWGEEKPDPFDSKPLTQKRSLSGVQLAPRGLLVRIFMKIIQGQG
ncbi:hypothetical protein LOD99_5332 [Oopsacas minuta]|uniref:DUF4817 domain-containing protein n=1 Tax=Oopsacas minuta TaxID=111878 RepID=A0AAV7JSL4_9METZ|nr:hypothetical protein LOD99_5332 [Oopsacas minuta]